MGVLYATLCASTASSCACRISPCGASSKPRIGSRRLIAFVCTFIETDVISSPGTSRNSPGALKRCEISSNGRSSICA